MTRDRSATRDSAITMITRRNVLTGLGAAGFGTLAALDTFTDVLETDTSGIGPENPPLTNPNDDDSDDSAFQTPWDADSLVISVEWNEQDSTDENWFKNGFRDTGAYDELQNATAFWNDYIEANAAFDLTLTFDPNASNPDIMLKQATITDECSSQYKGPSFNHEGLQTEVCVDTLEETPAENDRPVTGILGMGSRGQAVYRLIAQHVIGRLLGYDIWTDPVHVMTPKITVSPARRTTSRARRLLQEPSNMDAARTRFAEAATRKLETAGIRNPEPNTATELDNLRRELQNGIDDFTDTMNEWLSLVEKEEVPLYAEAYEETILNEDIAYLQDTVALTTEILDTYTREEIADDPDELDTLGDRLETISNWPDTTDPYDLRIHLYFTDAVWSEWAAEQTPTVTSQRNDRPDSRLFITAAVRIKCLRCFVRQQ